MNRNLLLPREKYKDEMGKQGPGSFTFEINNDKQRLFYFGANHSLDPDNSQYLALRKYWEQFLKMTGRNRLVLVEGTLRGLAKDEETAIKSGAEGNFITLLAHQAGVPVACPDISTEEFIKIRPDISMDGAILLIFLRWVDSFGRRAEPKPNFTESFKKWIESQNKKELFKDVSISLERFKGLYKKYIGKDFNEKEDQNYLINPNNTGTIVNETAREHSDAREIKIVSEIEKYWKERKNIFVVFGSGHLIIQRPALESLLK